jgi:hypothetical protein
MTAALEQFEQLNQHIDLMNTHAVRLNQEFYGDQQAWFDMYHNPAITNETWENWLDCMEVIRLQEPHHYIPGAKLEFERVRKYLVLNGHKPRCLDKGIGRNRHQPGFKALMMIRDIWNNVTGYVPPKPKPPVEPETQFQKLFELH